ncbi:No Apical Meristem domain transcriptional regulator superfamily protein [Prunus dulcis]|uniref:No Apical Meristem domain transcriptional regulator superfamily protein n=1 Tax=Prunus dulcis TaxID=3755 RepID=A0A4Y1RSL9_PRUDU|nr:No Apical Meristem domain transcriptional regulator superfamily protein [Prunus dulcis]
MPWLTDKYINDLPSGYRFVPTNEELIEEYLKKKIKNELLPINRFREVDVYKYHPEELTGMHNLLRESEWYFFSSRDRKYPNGSRPNRAADNHGYWKATGTDDKIKVNNEVIGQKRILDFYAGKHGEGVKTEWKMHEYVLSGNIAPSNGHKADGDMKTKSKKKTTGVFLIHINSVQSAHQHDNQEYPSPLIANSNSSSSSINHHYTAAAWSNYPWPITSFNNDRTLNPAFTSHGLPMNTFSSPFSTDLEPINDTALADPIFLTYDEIVFWQLVIYTKQDSEIFQT